MATEEQRARPGLTLTDILDGTLELEDSGKALDQVVGNYDGDSDSMSCDEEGSATVGEKGRKQPATEGYCVECEGD